MTAETTNTRASQGLPEWASVATSSHAHWFLRLPLAAIILDQGANKMPYLVDDAASYGFPLWLWTLTAVGEILAGLALIIGGLFAYAWAKNLPVFKSFPWFGDVVTRLGGLGISIIVAAVIYVVYWGPWTGFQLHLMMLGGGLFFLWRGNKA
ncbi:MAG: DoxX family membrane protein [Pseudomonadota bacterium]